MKKFKIDNRGVAALLIVIIVSAAALIIAFSASILGMGELDMGYISQQGQESYLLANGCGDEALRQLQLNASWMGGILNLTDGSCIIGVVANGDNRTISISSNINNFNKKLQILATINNGIVAVNSWQEVNN